MTKLLLALTLAQALKPSEFGTPVTVDFDRAALRELSRQALRSDWKFVGEDGRTVGVTNGTYSQLHESPALTTVGDRFRFRGATVYSVSQETYLPKNKQKSSSAKPVGILSNGLLLVASFPGASIWEKASTTFQVGVVDLSQRGPKPNKTLSINLKQEVTWVGNAMGKGKIPVTLENGSYGFVEVNFEAMKIKFVRSPRPEAHNGVVWRGKRYAWKWKGGDSFVGTKDGKPTDWVVVAVSMNGKYAWAVHLPTLESVIVSQ